MYLPKKLMMYKCEKTVFASEDQAFQSVQLLVKMTKTSVKGESFSQPTQVSGGVYSQWFPPIMP